MMNFDERDLMAFAERADFGYVYQMSKVKYFSAYFRPQFSRESASGSP